MLCKDQFMLHTFIICLFFLQSRYQVGQSEDTDKQIIESKSKFAILKPPSSPTASTSKTVTILTIISGTLKHYYCSSCTSVPFLSLSCLSGPWTDLSLSPFYFSSVACLVALCVTLTQALDALARVEAWSIVIVCILVLVVVVNTLLIWRQPQNATKASFMVRIF